MSQEQTFTGKCAKSEKNYLLQQILHAYSYNLSSFKSFKKYHVLAALIICNAKFWLLGVLWTTVELDPKS